MDDALAVEVRSARKAYGRLEVLKGLNMSLPYGCIYGLLGSSGCGKTTLLRCILGRLSLASGTITTLGQPPGSTGHSVPGRDVGYMPQERALYGDFTMLETMYYFGILHGMRRAEVKARGSFLLGLLELPSQNKVISKLSGGQQRRVSFAVAMLQEPPLLVLDEPTVGVDPLLRAKIWHHLLQLVSSQQTTIIITTHYIEEARQAHMVGLMRDGKLLAESAPLTLIQSYEMTTLEEVFLQLCRTEERINTAVTDERGSIQCALEDGSSIAFVSSESDDETTPLLKDAKSLGQQKQQCPECSTSPYRFSISSCNVTECLPRTMNILALCWKNFIKIYRNPGLLFFQFILPTLQIALFCLAVGRNLKGVRVAYVDADVGVEGGICNHNGTLGALYMSYLKRDHTFELLQYNDIQTAVQDVRNGDAWAAIEIGKNFTLDFFLRASSAVRPAPPDPAIINGSTIYLHMDVTNVQITSTIENQTLAAYEKFLMQILNLCNQSSSVATPPIEIHQPPVYGRLDLSFTDYMGPGIISSVTLGISIGLTAVVLLVERNEGLIDRTWVAGVNVTEMIIAQVVTQFFIILVQIVLMLVVVLCGFKIYNQNPSNIPLVGLLAMLQGLTGMALGLVISAVCNTESSALQAAIAAFYPAIILSGVIWPLEGMPKVLRYISSVLPATYPAEAMRAIMGRGWGLSHLEVWRGFLVTTVWFLFFLIIAGVALKIRK